MLPSSTKANSQKTNSFSKPKVYSQNAPLHKKSDKNIINKCNSKFQRPQTNCEKEIKPIKKIYRHLKHNSLIGQKVVLAEIETGNNQRQNNEICPSSKVRSNYITADSSRVQSPHDSICKDALKVEKKWRLVGVASTQKVFSDYTSARNDRTLLNVDNTEIHSTKTKQSSTHVEEESKDVNSKVILSKVQNIKCKKFQRNPLNTFNTLVRMISPEPEKEASMIKSKKIFSAAVSPKGKDGDKTFIFPTNANKLKNEKFVLKKTLVARTIFSEPVSPDNSMCQVKSTIGLMKSINKIQQAKEDLIKWMNDCIILFDLYR